MILQAPANINLMGKDISNNSLTPDEKISIFRSFFRGREDVYPRRFENRKSGKTGYAPVCSNEWVRGICAKPKIKCSECQHRAFLPVNDDVIRWHLSGLDNRGNDFVMGVYPMLLDETCFFLAADFDKTSWQEDALAFFKTCRQMNLPAAIERSRSGKGAHVWLFFEAAIPAALARKLGAHILTETMESRPDIGFDSYDRFFPNQDTLPKGGFGNLIALPLQKRARGRGNSVFIDDHLVAYEDQWAFLSSMQKISLLEVEKIVREAKAKDRIIGVKLDIPDEDETSPWKMSPSRQRSPIIGSLPSTLEIIISNEIYIPKESLSPSLRNRFLRLAAFQNPEFYRAQAMRLPTYDKPRIIACARDYPHHIGLPRGCFEDLCQALADLKIKPVIRKELYEGCALATNFLGELRAEQKKAAEEMLKSDIGVLSATTAFGKTVVTAWLIAKRQVSTLVLVHRKQLQMQWIQRLSMFLDLPPNSIGWLGGGRKKPSGLIDVALIQSMVRKGVVDDIVGQYGHLVLDECHHLPAQSFEEVVRLAKAKFVTGLTATMIRKDGHHPIITMQCGPVRYQVNAKEQAALRPFEHTVLVRPTAFRPTKPANEDARFQFRDLYDELIIDHERNQLICEEIIQAVHNGRCPVVLTERNAHLDYLSHRLLTEVPHLIVLRGGMKAKDIAEATNRLLTIPANEGRVVLATGKFIGEGFDDARLDTLFLTLPISWRGTIAQYVGRLHRLHDCKKEVQVYDYADLNVPMLERMFNRRCSGYEAVGYRILLPASAIPGWPVEVPLPVDPLWKADYAGTVRRLVQDGVDMPLAKLFVQAAVRLTENEEGINRARSATEAFLYRRLETLPQTIGKFRLNISLPIPFDGLSQMEIDLLSIEDRIAIELDGPQHLNNPDAYRRDRRKDVLLQENGYTILRFLTDDVNKHLDVVLNTILRTISPRNTSSPQIIEKKKTRSLPIAENAQ